jgi:threonine/homoserine/homoserine lactone efflux protein
MNEGWSRRQRAAIILVSVVASATAVGLSSDKSTENIALILLSTAAAAAVAWLSLSWLRSRGRRFLPPSATCASSSPQ